MMRVSSMAFPAAMILACLLSLSAPARAQTAPPPGSTINGTVPTSEGNVWNGVDHQPTPAEEPPAPDTRRQGQINKTLNRLDRQLLDTPLPKLPAGAPPVQGDSN